MSETHAPAHARRRISREAVDLQNGDVVRDYGVERTVRSTESSPSVLTELVIVRFYPDPDHPGLPNHLAVPAKQSMTVWVGTA